MTSRRGDMQASLVLKFIKKKPLSGLYYLLAFFIFDFNVNKNDN